MTPAATDRGMREAVDDAIGWTISDLDEVTASVRDGLVTVTGSVRSVDRRDRALSAALRVPGVRVVVDAVEIRALASEGRSDVELAEHVLHLLDRMPSLPVGDVRVQVRRGVVTVRGRMPNGFQRDTMLNLIGAIEGVRDVVDAVRLDHGFPDSEPARPSPAAQPNAIVH